MRDHLPGTILHIQACPTIHIATSEDFFVCADMIKAKSRL